jgi:NAD(P)-dependent dehydrogenase (short-subunit alcohol dehydrogenase family)
VNGPFSLEGKNVLVTGGTRGIGRAISLRFARAGARVLAVYARDVEAADQFAAEAASEGLSIRVCRADVTTDKGVADLLQAMPESDGPLTTFVHCAATGIHRPLDELTLRHFDWTFSLNVRSFFDLVQRLLPRFAPSSSVVALSSIGAVRAVPQYTLVGSTKGAIEALARHMAVELAPRGIRVNVLSPGTILTDVWKVLPDAERRLAASAARSPQGRFASLDEVASAAQFLCSDAASGVIGHTLVVDAGFSAAE